MREEARALTREDELVEPLARRKSAEEREVRRARFVNAGDHGVDDDEGRCDADSARRYTRTGNNASSLVGRSLERAHDGRSYGDHPPAFVFRLVDPRGGRRWNLKHFVEGKRSIEFLLAWGLLLSSSIVSRREG